MSICSSVSGVFGALARKVATADVALHDEFAFFSLAVHCGLCDSK